MGGFKALFALLTLASCSAALLGFGTVYLVSDLIDHAASLAPEMLVHFYIPAFVSCILGKELLDYFIRKYGEAFSTIYSDHLLLRFQKTLLQLPFAALSNLAPQKIQSLTSRYITNVRAFIEDWFWGSSRQMIQLLVTVAILYHQSPLILAGNLVYFAVFLAVALSISAKLSPLAREYATEDTRAATTIGGFSLQLSTVRRLGVEEFFSTTFRTAIHRKWGRFAAVRQFHARRWLLQLLLYDLGYISTLVIGVYQVTRGSLPLGYLVLIKYAFDTLSSILIHVIEYYVSLVQQRQDSSLVRAEFGSLEADTPLKPVKDLGDWHTLELRQARSVFRPDSLQPGSEVLIEIPSLVIRRGAKIGIVGPSGAGKTTLLQMLLNLVEFQGDYFCDGHSIKGQQLAPANVALINNSDPLFALTLRDNLVLGQPISTEQLRTVLAQVRAEDFTNNLEAQVGDPKFNLSSGQQQRIRLARGLLRNAHLLLLDEPFNGIDEATKLKIMASLRTTLAPSTVVLVTHNEQELALVDTVYRLERGRLAPCSQAS